MELEKIKSVIEDVLGFPKDEITENSTFVDDLGADSLDVVEIVMRLEEEFEITISDEAIGTITTVGDAAEQIRNAIRE